MPMTPRGALPASVYWRRRLVVLTVLGLVAIVWLKVTGSGDGSGDAGRVTTVAAPTDAVDPYTVVAGSVLYPRVGDIEQVPTSLPEPDGECAPDDVRLSPSATRAVAGQDVWWQVQMWTESSAACTFAISPSSMQLRVTKGQSVIWSTLDCPGAITTQDVVIGRSVETPVAFSWTARRSDSQTCTEHGAWAMPGRYRLTVAVLGGKVAETPFDLAVPGPS